MEVPEAEVSDSGRVTEGTVVTVTCLKAKRYVLFGHEEVTCRSGGTWSSKPKCEKLGTV